MLIHVQLQAFFARVVRFYRLSYNSASGVALLVILRLRGDRPCDVARCQTDTCTERRKSGDKDGNNDLDDQLCFVTHSFIYLIVRY